MKKVKLGQVATFINGYAFKPQDWSSEGKEIIRIQNLTKTSKGINYYSGTIDKKYIVEAGDILISWSGTLGVFQWCGRSAVLNQHIFKVVFDKIDIDKSYFKYVVEKGLQDAVKHTHGSTMKHLTKKYFDNIIVPYTNLGEQQRIASELDLLSKLILRRQEQLEELNLLVKSRFNEMFGENKIFESIDNLFDIIDGDRGKNYPKSDELFSEEYCLFLNTKNVTKNGFSFDTKQFITKTKDKLLRKGKLERYDIVLTTRGTVGNVAYYDELIKYKHLRINSGMVILRPKTPNLNQKFIIHVLRNNNYSRVISGSAQPQLPITKLKKILLPLPPLALQNEFADFVVQVDKSQYLRDHSTGATIPHLNKNILLDLQLELLGIEEQENIICILNTIKRLITKRKFQLDELNLLVKSRFNEMFGDPLNNNKKFAVKTGQQCFKFSSGKFLDKHDRVFEGYPAYGGNGIAWKSRKYLIDNPTIIIGRVGAYCGNVRTTHGKVWISDNAIYIKEFKNSDFNLVFLLELMKVIDFSKFADFSGQPKITQKPLENQKYILPPLALQNEFADFVVQVDKSQFACEIAIKVWRNSLKFSII
ncbi:type I RM modification enzyme [Streptococcus pneumoniae]|nr:type I RM modification enzyme [Streptococcus pneumoniae]CWM01894.1 type I RM modification enzyme [Streptococcus pneumoniae]